MRTKLRMTGKQHAALMAHLLPGDGLEAAAVLHCGRRCGRDTHVLSVRSVELIPHESCERAPDRVTWPTQALQLALEEAAESNLAVVKIHSHTSGYGTFSSIDDESDRKFFSSVHGWTDTDNPHASLVMLPDGKIFGRAIGASLDFDPLSLITVAGDDLHFFPHEGPSEQETAPGFTHRHGQAFGSGTARLLCQLQAVVVGCSGTGSIVVEQLARLGVGRLVLIDPGPVEERNLNRILNATRLDTGRAKVDVLADAVRGMGLGTTVVPICENLFSLKAAHAVPECDVAFGCMDGAEGRHLLNRLSAFYCLPYIDVGVRLEADGVGAISQICGGVNYLQPDGSSLLSRGLVTREAIQAEGLKRTNPVQYAHELRQKYIAGVNEDRPAVISVNMHYASLAVLELLARIHPYRDDGNRGFAWHGSSLTAHSLFSVGDEMPCEALARHVGRGDVEPLLDMPAFSCVSQHQAVDSDSEGGGETCVSGAD